LVVGGGYIGLEFAQMFRRFATAVTIVQRDSQLLPREDPDVAEEVTKVLKEDGIDILLRTETVRVAGEPGAMKLTVRSGDGERALETHEARGLINATVDADTKEILGCTVLGLEGGEVMTMVQLAMLGKLPYTALRDAIFSHPGLGEGLNTLFTTLEK